MTTNVEFQGINFMNKDQFDSQSSLSQNQVYAVEGQFVIETYVNGTSWYRVYSDSFISQGSTLSGSVTLQKTMSNTNYTILLGRVSTNSGDYAVEFCVNRYTTYFTMTHAWSSGSNQSAWGTYEVKGY